MNRLLTALLLLPVLAASADEKSDAIRRLHEEKRGSVVIVSFQVRVPNQPQAQLQRLPGVLVSDKGHVVVAGIPDQMPMSAMENLRVITAQGAEEEGYPAKALGRGKCPFLTFVKVQDPKKLPEGLEPLAFEEAEVKLVDDLLMITPSLARDRHSFVLGRCNFEMSTPAKGWGTDMAALPGCPAFTLDGKAVGIVVGLRVNPQQTQMFVLAASEFLPDLQDPPKAAAKGPGPQAGPVPEARPRGWLGVAYIQPIQSQDLAEDFGLPPDSGGVIIGAVVEDSPAAAAGLQVGDVVLEFQNLSLRKRAANLLQEFQSRLGKVEPGQKIAGKVWRDGKEVPVSLEVARMPKLAPQAQRLPHEKLGFVARELVLDDRYQQRLPKDVQGVLLEQVAPGTPAGDAGLAAGDVLQEVGARPVKSIEDLRRILKDLKKERASEVYVTVRRRKDTLLCRLEPRWDEAEEEAPEE